MSTAKLTIDLTAICDNWRALAARCDCETAAVVKADGYGLGVDRVSRALAHAGVRRFFVAAAEEGAEVRQALGPGPEVNIFSGHMAGDTDMIGDLELTPMLNSVDQMLRHVEALPGAPFGLQLDTGMNRLGMEPGDWAAVRDVALSQNPTLVMSHLACADEPDHAMNRQQLQIFHEMTDGIDAPRSLAATGGILLGSDYHFDLVRPGVGLYGGFPFTDAKPVARLDVPVIQTRDVEAGETVGYANSWTAPRKSRIATIAAGYADGLIRAMGDDAWAEADGERVKIVGRVSMDMIAVDVTNIARDVSHITLLSETQTVDDLAAAAGTIGYEILTSLGGRYTRAYTS